MTILAMSVVKTYACNNRGCYATATISSHYYKGQPDRPESEIPEGWTQKMVRGNIKHYCERDSENLQPVH